MDRCKWRKVIKEARWSGWVSVGECFFWYRPTRVVPDQRPLNGRKRSLSSVLWCCWLGGTKVIWPVKNWVVGCWHGYLSGSRCKLAIAYGPADGTATHCLLLHLNPDWFCLLVLAHLGSPRQRVVKWVCVCFTCLSFMSPIMPYIEY